MMLVALFSSILAEIILLAFFRTRYVRLGFAWLVCVLLAFILVLAVVSLPSLVSLSVSILIISLYRLCNMARIIKQRMHIDYMHRSVIRTSFVLLTLQAIGLFLLTVSSTAITFTQFGVSIGTVMLVIAVGLYYSLERTLSKSKWQPITKHYSDKELPTVTVAIPARNETDELTSCLQSVLANDYPKLEIIVLDDCSQDKTAEIIKSFAHDGVRFIKGDEPHDRWLSKNLAYDKLYREANGQFILFCGVDVRIGPNAIRALVTTALNRKKSMVSVMPMRHYARLNSVFIQPMRYWWELVPPRRLFNRPPVLSSCWLISRKTLASRGGFAALSRAIIPESFIARSLTRTDEYSFLIANKDIDVQTIKSLHEQKDTAIRVRYPQLKKRPELVLIFGLTEVCVLLGPFALFLYSIVQANTQLIVLSALTCAVLTLIHVRIVQLTNPGNVAIALFNFPLVVMVELYLLHLSMIRYEFGSVIWKERNVCIPTMHVVPHLPRFRS